MLLEEMNSILDDMTTDVETKAKELSEYLHEEVGLDDWMVDGQLEIDIYNFILEKHENEKIILEIDNLIDLSGNGWFD